MRHFRSFLLTACCFCAIQQLVAQQYSSYPALFKLAEIPDSIAVSFFGKLPTGSTPSVHVYKDSFLISAYPQLQTTSLPNRNLYLIDQNLQTTTNFSTEFNTTQDITYPVISPIKNLIAYTQYNRNKKEQRLYFGVQQKEGWKYKGKVQFWKYKSKIEASQPALNSANDLYFVAGPIENMGIGLLDIYFAKRQDAAWDTPENLGAGINSPDNDIAPVVYSNQTLFFSSNRKGGYGGYDMYGAFLTDSGYQVSNLGPAINSKLDEVFLIPDTETEGYLIRYEENDSLTPVLFNYKILYLSDMDTTPIITAPLNIADTLPEINTNTIPEYEPVVQQPDDAIDTEIPKPIPPNIPDKNLTVQVEVFDDDNTSWLVVDKVTILVPDTFTPSVAIELINE